MRILGFHFTKMTAERMKESAPEIKINTELDIPSLEEVKSPSLTTDEDFLESKFSYRVNYDPGVAKVVIEGKILFSVEKGTSKDVVKQWKKQESTPEDAKVLLFNVVMKKCTLKALALCDELNLPIHVPLPSLKKNK